MPAPTSPPRELDILAVRLHVIPPCLYGARVPNVYGWQMGNIVADRMIGVLVDAVNLAAAGDSAGVQRGGS